MRERHRKKEREEWREEKRIGEERESVSMCLDEFSQYVSACV